MLQGAQGQQILQTSSGQQIVVPIQGQAQQQTIQVRHFILYPGTFFIDMDFIDIFSNKPTYFF